MRRLHVPSVERALCRLHVPSMDRALPLRAAACGGLSDSISHVFRVDPLFTMSMRGTHTQQSTFTRSGFPYSSEPRRADGV